MPDTTITTYVCRSLIALMMLVSGIALGDPLDVNIALVHQTPQKPASSLSIKQYPADWVIAGAQLGVDDSNTTGRFLKHHYALTTLTGEQSDPLVSQAVSWWQQHKGPVLVSGDDGLITSLLTALGSDALVINVRNQHDVWRVTQCQRNLLHTMPSQAMLTDALTQFLVVKRWNKWLVVNGDSANDNALLASYQRSAKRFGAHISQTRTWTFETDQRRSAQQEVPLLTQEKEYDVVLVTDADDEWGFYIPFNTWLPRPVVGSHGLVPLAWHKSIEQWGAVQLQNRFVEQTGRTMDSEDYAAWLGVRAIAEAVTRTQSTDSHRLNDYLLSDQFELAAFKGRKLTFRNYNGQLRQPVALAQPDALVSQSPQQGFLHPKTDLDTLGYDQPEVHCSTRTQ